jgi:Tol biopolymer transport system component/DNA-binding winged helix-turn-helix (wHTH) protein
MAETQASHRLVRFGAFEADLQTGELRKDGEKLKLGGQPFQVLAILLERPGDLVTREELQKRLWPETFVDFEGNLNTAINKIREVLGDSAENPRYVETLPRRGYRFIEAVEPIGPPVATAEVATTSAQRSPKLWLIPAAIAVLAAAILYVRRPLPPVHITNYSRITLDGKLKFPVGSDGNRVYMNVWSPQPAIGQVPISGGQTLPIHITLPNGQGSPELLGVSPDGSSLLVLNNRDAVGDGDLSVVGSQGYPARYLARGFNAAWSPDGKFVVYSTFHGELYVIPSDGRESRLLASLPRGVTTRNGRLGDEPQWSPDGRTIRFDRDSAIWEVSSNGTNLHQILAGWRPSSFRCCGHWTADGGFYIFVSGTRLLENGPTFTPGAQLWAIDERHEGWRSRISQPIQLTSGPMLWDEPISTRDPTRIIARGINIRGELVRYDSDSKQLQPFLGGISADFVSFSHDGKSVAYVSSPDGILWRANLDGSDQVQLTSPPFYPKLPRWSPDGTQILFMDNSPEAMYVVPVQGGTPQRILPDDNGSQFDPNWSPDGKSVIYASFPGTSSGRSSTSELRILDLASHKVATVPGSQGMWSVRWSPDGRHLAALTSPIIGMAFLTYPIGLAVFDVESQRWTELDKGIAGYPTFSRDGSSIYYLQLTQRLVLRIPVSGGQPERIIDLKDFRLGGWWGFWMGLDPTDAPLLLRDEGTNEIYSLSLDRP